MVKCQYDIAFVQEYREGILSVESKAEYERHLSKCQDCRQFMLLYDLLTRYVSRDVRVSQAIPTEAILSKLDTGLYDKRNIGSKIRASISKLLPAKRILACSAAAIIIFVIAVTGIVFFDIKFSELLNGSNDRLAAPKPEEQVIVTTDAAMSGTEAVSFVDAEFEKRIREMLKKQDNEPIYKEELSRIDTLDIKADTLGQYNGNYVDGMYQYVDKEGIEHNRRGSISTLDDLVWFSNLSSVTITANEINDIDALAGFPGIRHLDLCHNGIENIASVSKLSKLSYLGLEDNEVTDIGPLAQLFALKSLEAGSNRITDLSALKGLENLEGLWLYDNRISDISPLKELNRLRYLGIQNNKIEDISVLSDKTGLTWLFLSDNRIADLQAILGLRELERLGVAGNPAVEQISAYDFENLEMLDGKIIDMED